MAKSLEVSKAELSILNQTIKSVSAVMGVLTRKRDRIAKSIERMEGPKSPKQPPTKKRTLKEMRDAAQGKPPTNPKPNQ